MYLFFDTETTGLPKRYNAPLNDFDNWPRLVQIAWILYDNKGKKILSKDYIIKPEGFTIPHESSLIHGITTARAIKEGCDLVDVLSEFEGLLDEADFLIGHNIDFDQKIMCVEFLRMGNENCFNNKAMFCTMKASTNFCAINSQYGYKWPKLSELHYKLFEKDFDEAHNALKDIEITAKCFWEMKKRGIISLIKHS
ncbi:3'-5' exonuclease [bacterium]|jgi:DNA polymerase III epsilon subunit-like protein|nr:3'-5' exonuclease [bacterium]